MIARAELAAWLRLVETPGLGRAGVRRLLAALGSPENVLAASHATLAALISAPLAHALLAADERRDALPLATWRWLESSTPGGARDVIVLGDPRYPALLLETADPPLLLYTLGRAELLNAAGLALVGSRHATPQGLANARAFAHHLSARGLCIVSGLASGVDGAAHEGGLLGPGSTVAFVGTGLDQTYPARHAKLARRIAEEGLVASEYPLGMPPLPINFPRRNRLIAGITQGTLVVEAALQSGSLITARLALESGREVFAIPGSIHSPQARGCHRLIQEGAKLVATSDDILDELQGRAATAPVASLSPRQPSLFAAAGERPAPAQAQALGLGLGLGLGDRQERGADAALLRALGHDPVTFDTLAARTGLPIHQLSARLLVLELEGQVARMPGGLLQRQARA